MHAQTNNKVCADRDDFPMAHPCLGIRLRRSRRGFTLMELMVVLTIMGVMLSFAVPNVHRTIEQLRADIATANLRSIWSAQRLYWLDNRTFTDDLTELEALGLLDPSVSASTEWYVYSISAFDATSFTALATRSGSARWTGNFSISDTGVVGGSISAVGESDILPGIQ